MAVAYLSSVRDDEQLFRRMAVVIVGIWSEADGPAAAAWLDTEKSDQVVGMLSHHLLASWSKTDSEEAYAWYRERIESGTSRMGMESVYHLSGNVFRAWMKKDPVEALKRIHNVPVEDERSARGGIADAVYRSRNPAPMLEAIQQMPESDVRSKLVESVTKKWGTAEPAAAADWLDTLPMEDEMARFRTKMELAEVWMRGDLGDLANIEAWLLKSAPDDEMHAMVKQMMQQLRESNANIQ